MKTTLLALLAICVALIVSIESKPGPTPTWYYASPCQQPPDQSLEQWLPNALPIENYEWGVFDCSELSAYAEWLAESCGYNAQIAVVLPRAGQSGHAWVIVEGRTLDAQTGVWDAEPWLPAPDVLFENVAEAVDYSAAEWNWWIAKPELR